MGPLLVEVRSVLFAVVYLLLRRLVRLLANSSKDLKGDVEVVVLRHQLMVLRTEASTWRPRSRGLIRPPVWQGRPVSGGATCCAALCMRTSLRVESEFLCLSRLELTQDGMAPSFGMQHQRSRAPAPMCLSGRCLDEKSRTRIDRLSGSRPGRLSGDGPGFTRRGQCGATRPRDPRIWPLTCVVPSGFAGFLVGPGGVSIFK